MIEFNDQLKTLMQAPGIDRITNLHWKPYDIKMNHQVAPPDCWFNIKQSLIIYPFNSSFTTGNHKIMCLPRSKKPL